MKKRLGISLMDRSLLILLIISSYCTLSLGESDCENGIALPDGTCDCFSCWQGENCDQYASRPPVFPLSYDHLVLTDVVKGKIFYKVQATDPDEVMCKDPEGCHCSTILYTILDQGDEDTFVIDKDTGELSSLTSEVLPPYEVTIGASNGGGEETTMLLSISGDGRGQYSHTMKEEEPEGYGGGFTDLDWDELHHRHKRSAVLPSEVTFTLTKEGANANDTTMKVGTKYDFKLQITMPSGDKTLKIELFAPDFDYTVMMLCDVEVINGNAITFTGSQVPVMESQNGNNQYDRAIIDLGTVTNTPGLTTADSQIEVTYSAIMIENSQTTNAQYWVSAGAEYDNSENVWIGQAGFTADTTDDSASFSSAPEVTVNGPASLEIGEAAVYTVKAKVHAPYSTLKFNTFGGVNTTNALGACGSKLESWGVGYSCGNDAETSFAGVETAEGDSVGYGRSELDLGRPINSLARLHQDDSNEPEGEFDIKVLARMYDNEDNIGSTYNLGFSIEIGTSTLWVAQTAITAVAKTSVSPDPAVSFLYPNGQSISSTSPGVVELQIDLPDDSVADYILEVTVPDNNGAVLQLCAVVVSFVGENIPCMNPNLEATYSATTASSLYNNIARLELGKLSSAGSDWSTNSTANTVRISIAVKSTDHSDAGVGSSHSVAFALTKDGSPVTINDATLYVASDAPPTSITNEKMPVINMTYGGDGTDVAMPGQTIKALADIQTYPGTVYIPFNFEAIMPNVSGVPLAKICKVELQSAGKNTPCMLDSVIQSQVQMLSSFDDGVIDRAVLSLSGLCNLGLYHDDGADNFVLGISFVLLDSTVFDSTPEQWVSMGLAYSSSNLWVGQISITADTSSSMSALAEVPNLEVVPNNGALTNIPLGYTAKFLVRIKIRPGDFTMMTLNVSTTDDALSVCAVKLVRAGNAYPCIDTAPPTLVTDHDEVVGVNRKGSIDLGYLANVGADMFVADSYYDENTVEVEVQVRLTTDTGLASEGSTHGLGVDINYDAGHGTSHTATGTVTATTSVPGSVSSETTADSGVFATLTAVSITGNDSAVTNEDVDSIVVSESKRLVLEYPTERGLIRHLQLEVSTPDSDTKAVEVEYIGLLSAGANLGCLTRAALTPVYSKRNGARAFNDLGTLDLGYVCNTDTVNNTEADTLKVEIVVRLLPTAVVSVSELLSIDVALSSNAASSYQVVSKDFTVADLATYQDFERDDLVVDNSTGITFNSSESSITMPLASFKVLPFVFMVPPYSSSKVYLDVEMPVNTSAIMTFTSFTIVRAGRSLSRLTDFVSSYTETLTSRYNTSQTTKYELDLGVITNTGVMRNEPDFSADDDTFSAELTVQMADSVAAEQGTSHVVSVGLHAAKFVFILDLSIQVDRTSNDLVFNLTSAVDDAASNPNRVEVDTILGLSDLSTAEGQETVLSIFHPPYVSCQASITSNNKEIVSQQQTQNSLSLNIGPLFFTDEVHIKTVLEANTSYAVPVGISGSDSVLLFQPTADKHDTSDISGDFEYVNITVTTTTEVGTGCSPGPLGLENGGIKDCQISVSPESLTPGTDGRYTTGTGWTPFVHYGAVRQERYFQVYFGDKVMVSKIKMQQSGTAKATTVKVRYSNDGMAWVENQQNTMTADTSLADQDLSIPAPESSRYIRVMINDLDDNASLATFNFEFVGCKTTTDGPADPCIDVITTPTTLSDFKRRTFLVADTTVYVCDMIQGDLEIKQKCYSSPDHLTWTELDERVGSLVGYESEEPRIFAVSNDGLKYMSSVDGGVWMTSVPGDITLAKAKATFKAATVVPHTNTDLNVSTPDPKYRDMPYGATMMGLRESTSWDVVFSWSQCCP